MNLSDTDLEKLLKRHFNLDGFKPGQKEIITDILSDKDILVVRHRGSDQSVIYKLPALILDGLTLVVSRSSQIVDSESDDLLPTIHINNSLPAEHLQKRIRDMADGKYKLVYVGPEQFRNRAFLFAVAKVPMSLLVVEDAHCISRWGHDFNPDYLNISKAILDRDSQPCILALAGACTQRTRNDILHQLQIDDTRSFILDLAQPNLSLEVISAFYPEEKYNVLRSFVQKSQGQGVVYTNLRNKTVEICELLKEFEPEVAVYHGGLSRDKRIEVERAFSANQTQIVVATSFLNFGLNHPNIRYVIHFDMPDRLERYYEQIGTAGGDEQPARCVLIYSPSDQGFHHSMIEKDTVSPAEIWRIADVLRAHAKDAGEKSALFVLTYEQIELEAAVSRTKLHLALREMKDVGMLNILPDCSIHARAKILAERDQLTSYVDDEIGGSVIEWLLSYLSKSDPQGEAHINLTDLSKELSYPQDILEYSLLALNYAKAISYIPSHKGMALQLVNLDAPLKGDVFEKLKGLRYESLRAVEEYVHTKECRQKFLCNYLDDEMIDNCGKCDNCTTAYSGATAVDLEETSITPSTTVSEIHVPPARLEANSEQDRVLTIILRCAEKTDGLVGRYGMMKILLGEKSKKLAKHGFDHIEEYGSLSDLPKEVILRYIDAMIERGCLSVTSIFFPLIQLTEAGRMRLEKMTSNNLHQVRRL